MLEAKSLKNNLPRRWHAVRCHAATDIGMIWSNRLWYCTGLEEILSCQKRNDRKSVFLTSL